MFDAEDIALRFALFLVFRLIMAGQVRGECLDGWVNVLKSEDSICNSP